MYTIDTAGTGFRGCPVSPRTFTGVFAVMT